MKLENSKSWYRQLYWQIFLGMLAGVVVGLIGGSALVPKVEWLGILFIRLLRMVIVPLVLTSIVSGVAAIDGKGLGRLFGKIMGYYLLSSTLAILVGLTLVNLLRPGTGADIFKAQSAQLPELSAPTSLVDLLLDMVPKNVIEAMAKADILGLIFFCLLFGAAVSSLPDRPRQMLSGFFQAVFQTMMQLTGWVIRLAPLGVFGLIARVVGISGWETFRALGQYMLTIALGLSIHLFLILPFLLVFLGRISPVTHFRNMVEPLATAFSTSSSGATLPVTLRSVETKVGVSNWISSFVLPLGATVNMDGTALYECAGVLFISQVVGIELSFSQQLVVVITALLASIGAAAVPSAGLVIIFLVLEAVNLRGPQIDVIVGAMLAIDRPLDMYRTAVNVFSDSCGAAIIAKSEGESGIDE